jgi:hypothetical protein
MVWAVPISLMMKPEVVNIPVPIMLATTRIVAEKKLIFLFRSFSFGTLLTKEPLIIVKDCA